MNAVTNVMTEDSCRESAIFFPGKRGDLFGVLHEPKENPLGACILCHPFAEEKLWSQRVFVSFARELARRGLVVLRFDFSGNGESDGVFESSGIRSYIEDTSTAVEYLRAQYPTIESVDLMGLRFGATVAYLSAVARDDVGRLILWDPVLDGEEYVQEMLRINLATQMAVYGKVTITRENLVEGILNGTPVNIDGYLLGESVYKEFESLKLTGGEGCHAKSCFVSAIGRMPKRRFESIQQFASNLPAASFESVQEEAFWREIRQFYNRADKLFEKTLNWMGLNDGHA